MPYLFVHFREKATPDGEQVHFAVSRNGFSWESLAGGNPIVTSDIGERGVRDMAICRTCNNEFVILATDLSLANNLNSVYHGSWGEIKKNGSHQLIKWTSKNLLDWSAAEGIEVGAASAGCVWAPDVLFDQKKGEYLIHWSSPEKASADGRFVIYYTYTKDFNSFSPPEILYQVEEVGVIDSALYEIEGRFYLFFKQESQPTGTRLLTADQITGPFQVEAAFENALSHLKGQAYEAPTAACLEDGRWYLFLDYYGSQTAAGQGYVPFVTEDIKSGRFHEDKKNLDFPYGFKHGSILEISEEEYLGLTARFGTV